MARGFTGGANPNRNVGLTIPDESGLTRDDLSEEDLIARRDGSLRTGLNVAELLSLGDTEPERNPRAPGTELIAQLYRRLADADRRLTYLEQKV